MATRAGPGASQSQEPGDLPHEARAQGLGHLVRLSHVHQQSAGQRDAAPRLPTHLFLPMKSLFLSFSRGFEDFLFVS